MTHNDFDKKNSSDHAFDPFLWWPRDVLSAVEGCVLDECSNVFVRKRRRKEHDEDRFARTLLGVVANALKANDHPTNKKVHYSRKAETYSADSIYYPAWVRHTNLIKAVNAMIATGYLTGTVGDNNKGKSPFSSRPQSTFQATPKLVEKLASVGVTSSCILKSDVAAVILKDGDKKVVKFDPKDPEVQRLVGPVREYNAFIKQFRLSLDSDVQRLRSEEEARGQPIVPINFDDIRLQRIFNNGDWTQGGRWNGGWWMPMPSKYRQFILIDGKKTVELDFSGFLTRGIYHLNGTNYEGDPYEIESILLAAEAQGLKRETVRDSIKKLTNTLINASRTEKLGKISGLTLPKGFKQPNKVYPLIEEKHKAISGAFRSGLGIAMMREESDICEKILIAGKHKGVLVLPIHDSFVVQEEHESWLNSVMLSSYRDRFGFDPVIKKKERLLDQAISDSSSSYRDHLSGLFIGGKHKGEGEAVERAGWQLSPAVEEEGISSNYVAEWKERAWAEISAAWSRPPRDSAEE